MTRFTPVATQWVLDRTHHGELTEASAYGYRGQTMRFGNWLDGRGISLEGIRQEHIEEYLASMRVGPTTVSFMLSVLRSFFGWALSTGKIKRDPTAGIRGRSGRRRCPATWPPTPLRRCSLGPSRGCR